MIALYIPFVTNPSSVNGCSIHNTNKIQIRKWVEENPHSCFIWPVYDHYDYCEILNHERIIKIPITRDKFLDQYRWGSYVPEEIISRFYGEDSEGLFLDMVFNPKLRAAPYIASMLDNPLAESIPIVSFTYFVTSTKEAYYKSINPHFEKTQYQGLSCSYVSYDTDELHQRIISEASRFLSISEIRDAERRRLPNTGTINVQRVLDASSKSERSKDEMLIQYSGRLSSSMSSDTVFEAFESLYSFGRDVKIVVTSQGSSGRFGRRIFSQLDERGISVEKNFDCPQEKFWEISGRCHVTFSPSKHGEFFNARLEQIVAGVVPIIRRSEFQKALWKDYPFSYSTKAELDCVLRFVVENYWSDDVQVPFKKLRDMVIETYDVGAVVSKLAPKVLDIVSENRSSVAKGGSSLFLAAQAIINIKKPSFSYEEFADSIKETSATGIDVRNWSLTGKSTRLTWHRVIGHLGYEGIYDHDLNLSYIRARDVDLEAIVAAGFPDESFEDEAVE